MPYHILSQYFSRPHRIQGATKKKDVHQGNLRKVMNFDGMIYTLAEFCALDEIGSG